MDNYYGNESLNEINNIPEVFNVGLRKIIVMGLAEKMQEFINQPSILDPNELAISAGHLYERKGYLTTDELGGERNLSYGTNTDDIVVQIRVRIPHHEAGEILGQVNKIKVERTKQKRESIQRQINELKEQEEKLKEQLDELEDE